MRSAWRTLSTSAIGTSHRRRGEVCQDYSHELFVESEHSNALILVCSDGAGSAPQGLAGAKLACHEFIRNAALAIEGGLSGSAMQAEHFASWYESARRRLALEACLRNQDLSDFSCTLLASIICDDFAAFSQIGDGAIVYGDGNDFKMAFWPQSGEYANTTFFLTGRHFEDHLVFKSVPKKIDEVALITDGLQQVALHYATRSAHVPFFEPIFAAMRKSPDPAELELWLRQFLMSPRLEKQTDDDKTLLLATRRTVENDVGHSI